MVIPGRSFSSDNYRFGFNGKEDISEVEGADNFQDYGMRIYNPRLSRFISTDPLAAKFPWWTPYQFAGNSPIGGIDLDGLEFQKINSSMYQMKYNGSSTWLNIAVDFYLVGLVFKNIPEHYVDANPRTDVGTYGHDEYYSGPMIYATETPPPPSIEDEGKDATYTTVKKNAKYHSNYIGEQYNIQANNVNAIGGALQILEDVTKWAVSDLPQQLAGKKEIDDRNSFYKSTNWVDYYISNGELAKIGAKSLTKGQGRADLINYVNDGTLPEVLSKGTNEQIGKSQAYRKSVEDAGNVILKTNDIPIQTSDK